MQFSRFCSLKYWLVILAGCLLLTTQLTASEKTHPITYYTELYPPSSYYYNEKLIGLSVDMLKLIWQDQGITEQPILVVPWARGYQEITHKTNTALFAMSKTADRAAKFKWVGPLFTAEYYLIAQPDSQLLITDIAQVYNKSIAVIRNDVTQSLINQTDFPAEQILAAKSMNDALALFKAKRVDLLAISKSGLNAAINQRKLGTEQFQRILLLNVIDDYIAFSKDTPDEIVHAFQSSLDKLKEQHLALKEEYKLH